ncbi:hypothetical protein NECID01_0909 [Nematocida sp. AWRm77]|nr:hypothetical protein NECID01_0909 [Nematocida sp. AWRm77]
MAFFGTTYISEVSLEENIPREKAFNEAARQYAEELLKGSASSIPLIIHPGRRVKTRREIREIEEPPREQRASQTVRKRMSKKERRKKDQVEEKIQVMMKETQTKNDRKGKARKGKLGSGKPGKSARPMRPGKSRRMNAKHDRKN